MPDHDEITIETKENRVQLGDGYGNAIDRYHVTISYRVLVAGLERGSFRDRHDAELFRAKLIDEGEGV